MTALSDPATGAPPHQQTANSSATLTVAASGVLLVLVAFTVPLATMAPTVAALHAGPAAQAWILSAMSVGAAAGLLSSGALGDDYGRRRVFVGGAAVLTAGSLLAALAPSAAVLIAARVVQGLGGAAMMSCSLGLIAHAFPPGRSRTRATGIWGAALGGGVAVGPLLAVGLDAAGSWRLSYWACAAAAIVLTGCAQLLLTESHATGARRVDVAGTVLLGAGLAAVLAGLVQGRSGWLQWPTLVLLTAGVVLVAGFLVVEHRISHPMLDLALFRRPEFIGATGAALAAGAGVLSLMSFVPILIERGLGGGELAAAVTLLAWSGVSVLTALAARHLPDRVTGRAQMVTGLLGVAAGQLALLGLTPTTTLGRLLPGLLLVGAANGLLNAALGRQAVASVPAHRAAMGSGANNTARYLGSAIGITVVSIIVTRGAATASPAALTADWNLAVLVTTTFTVLGALAVAATRPRPNPR
ncbi:MFS transporter [Mycobacterium sp. ZZG]